MNSTFGARLRSRREQQQISLTTIGERTKIKVSLLEALERDDLSHWPRGIFGRSYIRSYAQAIGLDPDVAVREFAACHSIEPVEAPLAELREKAAQRTSGRPPTRLHFLIDSAIDAFHGRRAELPAELSHPPDGGREPSSSVELAVTPAPEIASEPPHAVDFLGLAKLCARLASAQHVHELTSVLEDASGVLDSVGLILWLPDAMGAALVPAFGHGYPDEMIAQLPGVSRDAPNAIAEAFRTRSTCTVHGNDLESGAVVAPLLAPNSCGGVLSLEFRGGAERRDEVRAGVMLLAAQVSTVVGCTVLAQTRSA